MKKIKPFPFVIFVKDIIDALKRQGQGSVLEPVPGGSLDGQLEEGFPVELTK